MSKGADKGSRDADTAQVRMTSTTHKELEEAGLRTILSEIQSSARKAFAGLAEVDTESLNAFGQDYVDRVSHLLRQATDASSWDESRVGAFMGEIRWAKLVTDMQVAFMMRDNDGGGGGGTCVTQCATEYDQCVTENGCDTSGWVCLCCAPCSLQYMGCVAKCTTGGLFSRGVFVA